MPLLLDRLPTLFAMLFMAVARRKKKAVRKKLQRTAKKSSRVSKSLARKKKLRKASKHSSILAKKQLAKREPEKRPPESSEPLPEPTPPFGRAILLLPPDSSYVDNVYPTFRWLSVGAATRYEVHWSEDAALTTRHATISLATEATVPVEKPLRPNGTYFWRVRGGNDAGWGPWSRASSFRVLEEA